MRRFPQEESVPADTEPNLRILRGGLNVAGGIASGGGFRGRLLSPGSYRIAFTTPFAGLPIVTASALYTPTDPAPTVAMVGASGIDHVDIEIRRSTDGAPVSRPFRFIAIGPSQ